MSAHVTELLALATAEALDSAEAARVEAHLRECAACAAEAVEWRRLAEGLGRLPPARPSRSLVARTVEAVEAHLAQRAGYGDTIGALGLRADASRSRLRRNDASERWRCASTAPSA